MSDEPSLEGLLAKALDSEPVKNLVSPATKEIGELLGIAVNVFKFYAVENLETTFGKWAKNRRDSGRTISAAEIRNVMPLLPAASMQSNEEMQAKWAALLESTASNPDDMLPSFGQTLAQINADEAKFLDRFFIAISVKNDSIAFGSGLPGEISYDDILGVYDPSLVRQSNPLHFGYELVDDDRDPELMARGELVIDDLVRMGIISARFDAISSGGDEGIETTAFRWYSLSPYGRRFIQAVS